MTMRKQMGLHGQGEDVAASDAIAMFAGSEGSGAARCIGSSSCIAPYLLVSLSRVKMGVCAAPCAGLAAQKVSAKQILSLLPAPLVLPLDSSNGRVRTQVQAHRT